MTESELGRNDNGDGRFQTVLRNFLDIDLRTIDDVQLFLVQDLAVLLVQTIVDGVFIESLYAVMLHKYVEGDFAFAKSGHSVLEFVFGERSLDLFFPFFLTDGQGDLDLGLA